MDFSMPGCDGPTATRMIRELIDEHSSGTEVKQPYICFLTAYSDKTSMNVANEAGCDNYLVKPIFKDKLQ